MNSLKIDQEALENARRQFCLDVCLPWEEYVRQPRQKIYIKKATYKKGTLKVAAKGARNYRHLQSTQSQYNLCWASSGRRRAARLTTSRDCKADIKNQ